MITFSTPKANKVGKSRHFSPNLMSRVFKLMREDQSNNGKPVSIEPLTPREIELMRFMADPFTDQAQAAEQLSLSLDTVESYLKHIYAKFGVCNIRQALQVFTQQYPEYLNEVVFYYVFPTRNSAAALN